MRELNNRLRKGESLLWESAPKNFTMLEGKLYIKIIGQWIITVIFAIWLFYVERNRPEFGTGMKALVVAVAAAIILAPFVEYYNLKRQKYYLTDQRAMVRTADQTWYYMDYDKIDECCVIRDMTKGVCIAMGSVILGDVRRQLRWQACHPKMDQQETSVRGEAQGIVLYQPEGAEKMIKIMQENGVKIDENFCA